MSWRRWAPLGADPGNPAAQLCIDLRHDLDFVSSLAAEALVAWVSRSPKPIRKVKTNAAPSIAPTNGAPPSFLGELTAPQIEAAGQRIRADSGLRQRLIAAAVAGQPEFEESPHVEEQIYASFIPNGDRAKMEIFHDLPWADRIAIVGSFEDARLRYYGYRLINERHPELLSIDIREFYSVHDKRRLMDSADGAKWNTLPGALAAITKERTGCTAEQSAMLDEYEVYLQTRIASGG